MTHLEKLILIIVLNLAFIGCNKDDQDNDTKPTKQEIFISSTLDIFDDLTTTYFPKDDVAFIIFKDENGFLTAKYELRGKTEKEIQKGSFLKKKTNNLGTTCDGTYSCGKAIYKCLEKGKNVFISQGACYSEEFCVTCVD